MAGWGTYLAERARRHVSVARGYMEGHLPRRDSAGLPAVPVSVQTAIAALLLALCMMMLAASPAFAEGVADREDNVLNPKQTADNSFLYDTSIYELNNADASYQGNTVQVTGEVVGDSIRAEQDPGMWWITLEAVEEEYESSISVLVPEGSLGLIDTYGAYNRVGTILQVRGTFHLGCPSHEGIMDIHAEQVTAVEPGIVMHDEFDIAAFIPGFIVAGIGIVLALIYFFLRERER